MSVSDQYGNISRSVVFGGGTEGYHTFRIPSIITTLGGKVLAFCEGRAGRHDHSENDIVLKVSSDSGRTWEGLQVVASHGRNCLNNPQPVILSKTGRVLLFYQQYPYGYHERDIPHWYKPEGLKSVLPGYAGDKICSSFLVRSDDEGATWSEPEDLTRQVKYEDAASLASGPGIGIEVQTGSFARRLIMPFNHRRAGQSGTEVYAAYSDDGGVSWKRGSTAPQGTPGNANEVQMVELSDGRIMLNARSAGGADCRKVGISDDGGCTWSPLQDTPELIDPTCMGSIIRHGNVLLFANAASGTRGDRSNGTVRASEDDGRTWTAAKVICHGRFAYSCLVTLPDDHVGCFYETGENDAYERLELARFSLDWLRS